MACDTFDFHDWQSFSIGAGGSINVEGGCEHFQNVARIGDGRFVVVYRNGSNYAAKVLDISSGSVVQGPQEIYFSGTTLRAPHVIALDSNTIIATTAFTGSAYLGQIDGSDNITFNAVSTVAWNSTTPLANSICPINSTSFAMIGKYFDDTGGDPSFDYSLRYAIGTVSGGVVVWGTPQIIFDGLSSSQGEVSFAAEGFGDGTFGFVFTIDSHDGATHPDEMYVMVGDNSGFDIAQITSPNELFSCGKIARLDTDRFIVFYADDALGPGSRTYMRIVDTLGGAITTVGSAQVITESTVDAGFTTGIEFDPLEYTIAVLSPTKIVIQLGRTDYDNGGLWCFRYIYLSVSSDVITITAYCDVSLSSNVMVFSRTDSFVEVNTGTAGEIAESTIQDILTCETVPGVSVLLLGCSSIGNTVYITAWADDSLVLNVLDIALAQQIDSILLGSASLAQVLANTYVAYPCAISDTQVYVYGRIATTAGLAHVMYSSDSGLNFNIIESGWAADYAGALVCLGSNSFYVARCNAYSTKLYSGTQTGTTLLSTLPFAGPMKPHGLRLSPYDDSILAAVNKANEAQTVLFAMPPYVAWEDITANHPQTAVNAVAPL